MNILDLMYQRMWQLQGRILEIRNYVKRDGKVISKKDFTLKDIPKIEDQIVEMHLGIKAIETYRAKKKKMATTNKN